MLTCRAYSRTPDQTRSWIFTEGQSGPIRTTHTAEGNFCIDAGESESTISTIRHC